MPATSAYQVGLETSNTNLSYAFESIWASLPASTFQGTRIISESLAHKKTRTRPGEIRGDRQAAAGLTTQETANGSVVMPVFFAGAGSASPFDDWMSCVLGSDWQAVTTVAGAAGDIALSGTGVLTSTTAGKFTGVQPGQTLKLGGFANAVNNVFYRVAAVNGAASLQLSPLGVLVTSLVAETPAGAAAKVTWSNLRNGSLFKSLYLQQRLDVAATKFFRYPGAMPNKASITLQLGQFLQASFDVTAQQELKGIVDASTGGIIAAPGTRDLDPVAGFKGVYWNDQLLTTVVDQFSLDLMNDGAAGQYGLGSALAQGMTQGTFTGSGKFRGYFRDFAYYDLFRAETPGVFSVRTGDQAGNCYVASIPNATLLLDSGVNADGPNKALM